MCGIAGIVADDARRFTARLDEAIAVLHHRGPDGVGFHARDRCILGHSRLAIIDLETGDQPMLSRDGRVAITFNGEIYGFREIRRTLEQDYPFRTHSDTEVILALYERYGTKLLEHLPGMFAFAIWDDRTKTLFAARDRFGEKPFHFARGPEGELVFASEIKAILAAGLIRPELDRLSLAHYLDRRYVPVDRTIWSNVHTLPPAHSLTFRDGELSIDRYWDLPETRESIDVEEALEEFRRLLERSVSNQLVADVPVASFLSGGLDSTTVVTIASRIRPGLTTVSFGFGGNASELPISRQTARRLGTTHVEIEDAGIDLASLLVRMAEIFDEPHADIADIPTYLVCRTAREHAKVILTGEGGDELLAGYPHWYQPLRSMGRWMRRPLLLRRMGSFSARMARRVGMHSPSRLVWWLDGASLARRYSSVAGAHARQASLIGPRIFERLGLPSPETPPSRGGSQTVNDALRRDLTSMLPADWLTRVDRASMANGMELRSPFLDVDFASFCISLPARLKITSREEKWILRRAYEHTWTSAVQQKRKQGFSQDVDLWVARPEIQSLKRRFLDDPSHRLWELLPFEPMRALAEPSARRTLAIVTLGLWMERWFGRQTRDP